MSEEKVVEHHKPIVQSKPVAKKGLVERMTLALIGPNGIPKVKDYVVHEVIGPGVKDMLVDTVINGIQMLVYKDSSRPPISTRNRNSGYNSPRKTDYASKYRYSEPPFREDPSRNTWMRDSRQSQQVGVGSYVAEYAIPDRADAQRVLDRLIESAYEYGTVKLREFYDYIGQRSVYTDNNYGWSWDAIKNSRIRTTRDGYVIDLPPLEAL